MSYWNATKSDKYRCLVNTIHANGWIVDFFAVEVGARGYCSASVSKCLRNLGFGNKNSLSLAKVLSRTSMEASFCIWLARDNHNWAETNVCLKQSLSKHQKDPTLPKLSSHKTPAPVNSQVSSQPKGKQLSALHQGFVNKGNTCYANAILQTISVLETFWRQRVSENMLFSPLVKALILNMNILSRSSKSIDPSYFLKALNPHCFS